MQIQTYDGAKIDITSDIKHAGGAILDPTASGFDTLRQWIANGATVNNSGTPPVNTAQRLYIQLPIRVR